MKKLLVKLPVFMLIFVMLSCDGLVSSVEDMITVWDAPKGFVALGDLDTGLPVLSINTASNQTITSREDYITARVEIIDENDSGNNVSTATEIRGRGHSSWRNYGKKPYRLKFFEKQKLFNIPEKAKSWVLLANAGDETLLRNMIGFEMGKRFGLPFTNSFIPVELVLNGEYRGSYVITEQVQVGAGRVAINEDAGYLVELDKWYDEEPKFRTTTIPFPVMIKSPEAILNGLADNFVKRSLNELVDKMFAGSFPENGYRDLIDMDTFVDYIMIQEFLANYDFWKMGSVYMYKDAGQKICAGPLWDLDLTLGNPTERRPANGELGAVFFNRFFEDAVFVARYKERWNQHYNVIAEDMPVFIDEMATKLAQSQKKNYALWQGTEAADNYYTEVIDDLQTWWNKRVAFMNGEINDR
jgi:spore coat protein CotH